MGLLVQTGSGIHSTLAVCVLYFTMSSVVSFLGLFLGGFLLTYFGEQILLIKESQANS